MTRLLLIVLAGVLSIGVVSALPTPPPAYRAVEAETGADISRGDSTAAVKERLAGDFALVSVAGLPPVPGRLRQSAGSVVFQPIEDGEPVVLPLFQMVRDSRRASAVRLLQVVESDPDSRFLFHLGNAVIETAAPGILRDLALEPSRVQDLDSAWSASDRTLAPGGDTAAAMAIVRELETSAYADSVFSVLGYPAHPIGLVDERGIRAGRLGEYLTRRDSIALSPSYITSQAQLRHALAHELAHRWLRENPGSAASLSASLRPIRDSLRYGYADREEQLAEALAFAVHFLQATASNETADPELLASYERLVPGTRDAVRMLITFPAYALHPLGGGIPMSRVSD